MNWCWFSLTLFSGVCGTGRCVDTETSFECICPWGKTGPKCRDGPFHRSRYYQRGENIFFYFLFFIDVQIFVPSFTGKSFAAYATPQSALTKLDLDLVFKARSTADGLILYVGANEQGLEDFFALAIKDRALELRFDVGSGTRLKLLPSTSRSIIFYHFFNKSFFCQKFFCKISFQPNLFFIKFVFCKIFFLPNLFFSIFFYQIFFFQIFFYFFLFFFYFQINYSMWIHNRNFFVRPCHAA